MILCSDEASATTEASEDIGVEMAGPAVAATAGNRLGLLPEASLSVASVGPLCFPEPSGFTVPETGGEVAVSSDSMGIRASAGCVGGVGPEEDFSIIQFCVAINIMQHELR